MLGPWHFCVVNNWGKISAFLLADMSRLLYSVTKISNDKNAKGDGYKWRRVF